MCVGSSDVESVEPLPSKSHAYVSASSSSSEAVTSNFTLSGAKPDVGVAVADSMVGGSFSSTGGQPVLSPSTEKYSNVTVSPACSTPCVYRPNFGATIAFVTGPEKAIHSPASEVLYCAV